MNAAKVKITVVRCLDQREIFAPAQAGCSSRGGPVCPIHRPGQQFVAEYTAMPAGFCAGAWADLFRFVLALQSGADFPWMVEPGTVLACCNDGFRPVIFRLERVPAE